MGLSKGQIFLKGLLDGMSPEDRKDLLQTLETQPRRQKAKSQHGEVKTFTTVVNKYHCITCDSRFTKVYEMSRGEQICAMDALGTIHTLNVTGRPGVVEVPHTTSHCTQCASIIKDWSREELEQAFLDLSKETPITYKLLAMSKRKEKGCGKVHCSLSEEGAEEAQRMLQERGQEASLSVCGEVRI